MNIIKKEKPKISLRQMFISLKPDSFLMLDNDLGSYARWLASTLKKQNGTTYKVNQQETYIKVTRL
jgi:hypothetical protein